MRLRKRRKIDSMYLAALILSMFFASVSFAQSPLETESNDLAQLKKSYFEKHRYSEFVDYLKDLKGSDLEVSYYIALSSYEQLKYLEEAQIWDEYFAQGNALRQQLLEEVERAKNLASIESPFYLYIRCLLWCFYDDMYDPQKEETLSDLIEATEEYAASTEELSPLKVIAEKLADHGKTIWSARIYKLYLERLITQDLENKEERLISLAKEIIKRRPFFAEEIFRTVEELNPEYILGEETQYLRAHNLEKVKDYQGAKQHYEVLLKNYPKGKYNPGALFKIGVISLYVLNDALSSQNAFNQVIEFYPSAAQALSSLYQLGLFFQYKTETEKAKEYYSLLLEKSSETPAEVLVAQTNQRLKEIEEGEPLEFNLKTFLDACFKKELTGIRVSIEPTTFLPISDEKVNISAYAIGLETGCLPVNLEYLWSGSLPLAVLDTQETISSVYGHRGTKVIQVVVISPAGIEDRNFIFLDVE